MSRLLNNRKALSPVVAAIILIAVTVAVSIAVAAWMGLLSFTFMKTEELKITSLDFGTGTGTIDVVTKNTGTAEIIICEAWVNNEKEEITSPSDLSVTSGEEKAITVSLTSAWIAGNKYEIELVTRQGNKFIYTTSAPW